MSTTNGKIIAKNTVFLYFRMLITMIISLYTSRVILKVLGVDDYGIYQAVGGIVSFLAFINGALSSGISRFLTYDLGIGDEKRLKKTFSTTLTVQIYMALIIAIIAETVGLWYFSNKMVIPDDRYNAASIVFHISIITSAVQILIIPFSAAIIAHERMQAFAYIGIAEAIGNLGIAFALDIGNIDKLVLYAILLLLFRLGLFMFYVLYCYRNFSEVRYKFLFLDKNLFKQIFSFSSWSLLANGSIALNNQGILLLLNYFFTPAVVTARTISLQVNNVANQFVSNFRTAVNPQIVKNIAIGDTKKSHILLLQSTKYSFYLMLILCLPICLLSEPLLNLWLYEVPAYATPFLQIVIVQSLFQVFDTSFYTAMYAKGRIKENAIISPSISMLQFPVVFILFKVGCSPLALSWASLITYMILGLLIKPYLIVKYADYQYKEIFEVFSSCFKVTLVAVPIPILLSFYLEPSTNLLHAVILAFTCLTCVASSVWLLGLSSESKELATGYIKNMIGRKN